MDHDTVAGCIIITGLVTIVLLVTVGAVTESCTSNRFERQAVHRNYGDYDKNERFRWIDPETKEPEEK